VDPAPRRRGRGGAGLPCLGFVRVQSVRPSKQASKARQVRQARQAKQSKQTQQSFRLSIDSAGGSAGSARHKSSVARRPRAAPARRAALRTEGTGASADRHAGSKNGGTADT